MSCRLQAAATICDFAGIRQSFASFLTILTRFGVCPKLFSNTFSSNEYTVTFLQITLIRLQDKLSGMSRITAENGTPGADFVTKFALAGDSESQFGRCTHVTFQLLSAFVAEISKSRLCGV